MTFHTHKFVFANVNNCDISGVGVDRSRLFFARARIAVEVYCVRSCRESLQKLSFSIHKVQNDKKLVFSYV